MSISEELLSASTDADVVGHLSALGSELCEVLARAYGAPFTILDGESGEVLSAAPEQPSREWALGAELCREVARRGCPEFIEEEGPFCDVGPAVS